MSATVVERYAARKLMPPGAISPVIKKNTGMKVSLQAIVTLCKAAERRGKVKM